ncbi:hypothetical protein K1T71_007473 [Dendrolimus kikuchii]|uniref:Uncharacterized protein n=1 Tax=Dendrolimus kikuchii TaxID=765133 RepID=A0ACC1D0G7_9NEOP|nr:hypothetical protein K1T71_007473 [Dendrolimus kikuchii]
MDNKPQFVSTFIELYRTFPCLWKVKDDSYHNKRLKDDAYNKLLAYYQITIPSATIDTVKRKINNLKSTFRKELKKVSKYEFILFYDSFWIITSQIGFVAVGCTSLSLHR